jgi:hypothetical protein
VVQGVEPSLAHVTCPGPVQASNAVHSRRLSICQHNHRWENCAHPHASTANMKGTLAVVAPAPAGASPPSPVPAPAPTPPESPAHAPADSSSLGVPPSGRVCSGGAKAPDTVTAWGSMMPDTPGGRGGGEGVDRVRN